MKQLSKIIMTACKFIIIMTIICGFMYTFVSTGIGAIAFPNKTTGDLITITDANGREKVYGSQLIGQKFTDKKYLIGRPMEVSQLSPFSTEQEAIIQKRVAWWQQLEPSNTADIPSDLVMASGSGVDPYISIEAATYQVHRIAKERGISEAVVEQIIAQETDGKLFGVFGEKRVHVLRVNLVLDGLL